MYQVVIVSCISRSRLSYTLKDLPERNLCWQGMVSVFCRLLHSNWLPTSNHLKTLSCFSSLFINNLKVQRATKHCFTYVANLQITLFSLLSEIQLQQQNNKVNSTSSMHAMNNNVWCLVLSLSLQNGQTRQLFLN